MPDLGKYATEVLGSYAVTLGLLAALIGMTLWRGARIKRQLRQIEERQKPNGKA